MTGINSDPILTNPPAFTLALISASVVIPTDDAAVFIVAVTVPIPVVKVNALSDAPSACSNAVVPC